MQNASLVSAVAKLAIAGEQAGFSLEEMIDLLDNGLSVGTLLELIEWRLQDRNKQPFSVVGLSRWII